jgi:hypothetical protein
MKKFLLIGLIIGLVLVLVGGGGVVYTRVTAANNPSTVTITTQKNQQQNIIPFGPGGKGNENIFPYGPGGIMRQHGFQAIPGENLLHDYIVSAFAKAVGLTVDQVNTRLNNGETLRQIAVAQRFTGDKLTQLATQVMKDAINQAVAAGVITQAQADKLLQLMQNNPGFGFGFDFGFRNWNNRNNREGQPTY